MKKMSEFLDLPVEPAFRTGIFSAIQERRS